MIHRTMDATALNEVANHPEVRPWLGGDGPVDLQSTLDNAANFGIMGEHGGWLLHPILPGVYEIHSMFAPEGRGKAFFAGAREMLRYMFVSTDALEIVTKCPDNNPAARMASAQVGFRERFRREEAWAPGVGVSYQVFSVDDWIARDTACLAEGRAFHAMLEEAKARVDPLLFQHHEDDAHDRAVGASFLMAKAGNMAKGVALYNRWASFAGYATIETISPTLLDVRDAIIEVRDGKMGVLKCRSVQPLREQE